MQAHGPLPIRHQRPAHEASPRGRRRWAALTSLCLSLLLPLPAVALYKVVGPDGRVTFTDRAPTEATSTRVTSVTPGASSSAGESSNLPYELRVATQKFPVTLYSTDKCDPCNLGRDLLVKRGIPFQERTVSSAEDKDAMEKQLGTASLPAIKIGAQVTPGFQASSWHANLDAAGYPSTSKLPSNFKPTAASTVAPRAAPEESAASKTARERAAAAAKASDAARATPSPSGSGGIRF